jgi:hypothetical protein
MAGETWYNNGKREIEFSPSDFLEEALDDFLESGAKSSRIASAVIKIATGVELLLKDYLEQICPALILEKLDDGGMQVAKIFNLGKLMRPPKDLDAIELRTATLPVLLKRATMFFDIAEATPHLHKLHKIRNSLIHHRGTVEILEVNLLLVEHIFPLVERLSKVDKFRGPRISQETWKKIGELKKLSVDALSSQLAKKLAHHSKVFSRLSRERISLLVASAPESASRGADLFESGLICPACKIEALAAFQDFDADFEDGTVIGAYMIPTMSCRVCGLELDEAEIRYIIENFREYVGDNKEEEGFWKASVEVEVDSPEDYY